MESQAEITRSALTSQRKRASHTPRSAVTNPKRCMTQKDCHPYFGRIKRAVFRPSASLSSSAGLAERPQRPATLARLLASLEVRGFNVPLETCRHRDPPGAHSAKQAASLQEASALRRPDGFRDCGQENLAPVRKGSSRGCC